MQAERAVKDGIAAQKAKWPGELARHELAAKITGGSLGLPHGATATTGGGAEAQQRQHHHHYQSHAGAGKLHASSTVVPSSGGGHQLAQLLRRWRGPRRGREVFSAAPPPVPRPSSLQPAAPPTVSRSASHGDETTPTRGEARLTHAVPATPPVQPVSAWASQASRANLGRGETPSSASAQQATRHSSCGQEPLSRAHDGPR